MPKKRDYKPKTMDELEEIFYGPNKNGRNVDLFRQRRYLDWVRGKVLSPALEDYVKKIFAPLGETEKIPENQKHTNFDYKIDTRKLLVEVKSLNITETSPTSLTKEEVLKKLKGIVDRVLAKDSSPFPGYRKGGAIVYTLVFNFFSNFSSFLDEKLPKMCSAFANDLDFLVFFHEPASISGKNSEIIYPPVFYVRRGVIATMFRKAYQGKNYKIFDIY